MVKVMPSEHRYIDGTLRQGYFCGNCGQPVNMIGTNHFIRWKSVNDADPLLWACEANPKLVNQLHDANPPRDVKPHYILKGVV